MPVERTRVVGPVMLPDGSAAPDGAKIVFTLKDWDRQGGALIMHGQIEAVVIGGAIDKSLKRSSGERGSLYEVSYHYWNEATVKWAKLDLGQIALVGPGPVVLADLLALPAPIPNVPDVLSQALGAKAGADAAAGISEENAAVASEKALQTSDDAVRTAQQRALAEAAANAALNSNWDYDVETDAALLALTGMTAGQTAYVKGTRRQWKYEGGAWVDKGPAITETLATKEELRSKISRWRVGHLFNFTFRDSEGKLRLIGGINRKGALTMPLEQLRDQNGTKVYYRKLRGPRDKGLYVLSKSGRILFSSLDASAGQDITALQAAVNALQNTVTIVQNALSSLTSRVDKSLTPAGYTRAPMVGKDRLRAMQVFAAKRALSENARLHLALLGDSYTQNGGRYSAQVGLALIAKYGDGGAGWTGYGWYGALTGPWVIGGTQPSGGNINGNIRPALYPVAYQGNWTASYNNTVSPDLALIASSTAGDRVRRQFLGSVAHQTMRLIWVATADGVIRYQVGSGAWVEVNTQGTVGNIGYTDIPITGASVVTVEVVAGTVRLCGDHGISNAPGIVVSKLAGSGAAASSYVDRDAAQQQAGWGALGIDVATVMLGTNDQSGLLAPATFSSRIAQIVTRLRAASVRPDVLVVMPAENARGLAVKMADYSVAVREAVLPMGCAFGDLQDAFGAAPADYDANAQRPLLNTDLIHPNDEGARLLRAAFLSMLIPF